MSGAHFDLNFDFVQRRIERYFDYVAVSVDGFHPAFGFGHMSFFLSRELRLERW
jgi:hypothetical protein